MSPLEAAGRDTLAADGDAAFVPDRRVEPPGHQ